MAMLHVLLWCIEYHIIMARKYHKKYFESTQLAEQNSENHNLSRSSGSLENYGNFQHFRFSFTGQSQRQKSISFVYHTLC